MKALTVRQPWAWAIIHGGKDIENRTTPWKYRGPLAIHAAVAYSQRGMRSGLIWDALGEYGWNAGPEAITRSKSNPFHLGAIIGVVDLVAAHVATAEYVEDDDELCCQSRWAEYEYHQADQRRRTDIVHLVLANPRPVAPIDCRGALGLWTVPDDMLLEVANS